MFGGLTSQLTKKLMFAANVKSTNILNHVNKFKKTIKKLP